MSATNENLVSKAEQLLVSEGLPDTPDNFDWAVGLLMGDERTQAPSDQDADLQAMLDYEAGKRTGNRIGRFLLGGLAVAALLFFAFAFGWFVMKPLPISIFLVLGFGGAVGVLLALTRPTP